MSQNNYEKCFFGILFPTKKEENEKHMHYLQFFSQDIRLDITYYDSAVFLHYDTNGFLNEYVVNILSRNAYLKIP